MNGRTEGAPAPGEQVGTAAARVAIRTGSGRSLRTLSARARWLVPVAILSLVPLVASRTAGGGDVAAPVEAALPTLEPPPEDPTLARRRTADRGQILAQRGRRTTTNLALGESVSGVPTASSTAGNDDALRAVDGDAETLWRGALGEESWTWTLPFRRSVHLGLLRAHFGDSAGHGVPAEYHWEIAPPDGGGCELPSAFTALAGGEVHDREGNTFLYGPSDVHAQKQALFADADACALRLVVTATDGGVGPVLRELKLLESAPSLTRAPSTRVEVSSSARGLEHAGAEGVLDGTYERGWVGAPRSGPWTVTIRLPEARVVDRVRLLLGADATMVDRPNRPGRAFGVSLLPRDYRVLTSPDDDDAHFVVLPEGAPPLLGGAPLPVRRRLVRFPPRTVKTLRLEIASATGPDGQTASRGAAPMVREVGIYEAADRRPVVTEPLFLSVDANPAGLLDRLRGGERAADAQVARDAATRLRRIVLGFDADTAWPVNAARKRDASAGRFLQVIEGDDPLLRRELLEAIAPPPILMLSGSMQWEFDDATSPPARPKDPWSWDPTAPGDDPDRGMGHLREAVRVRAAPMLGFCGGAQILALLDADTPRGGGPMALLDAILVRNENRLLRGQPDVEAHHERVWWSDWAFTDAHRPRVQFVARDPIFSTGDPDPPRYETAEVPVSHGDMIRASAFDGPLRDLEMIAWSRLCERWVAADGPEPTTADPTDARARCVTVPQAFRSRGAGYPLVGFQFHPEQRDLQRLAPGSPPGARGDALNAFANAIDLALEAYVSEFFSGA